MSPSPHRPLVWPLTHRVLGRYLAAPALVSRIALDAYPAAIACTSRGCSRRAPTFSSSTSRPTTSTSKLSLAGVPRRSLHPPGATDPRAPTLVPAKPVTRSARARGRPRAIRRVRRRDLLRSLVPRPHRDPHPRLRGRIQGDVLRWDRAGAGWGARRGRRHGARGGTNEGKPSCESKHFPPRCARNFSEYEEWRTQQLGDAATRPHRITYRRLTR